jgi:hypothetical protein
MTAADPVGPPPLACYDIKGWLRTFMNQQALSAIALDTFKDPYLLDVLGLRDGFLEADLEAAASSSISCVSCQSPVSRRQLAVMPGGRR